MVIFRNIPTLIKFYSLLPKLNVLKDEIDRARAAGDHEKERAAIRKAEDIWGADLIRIMKIDLHVSGQENLPAEGPVCFVSNHQGLCDIPCMFAAIKGIQFGFVAKDSLGKIPVFGNWIVRIRSALIKRGDQRASLKVIIEGIEYIKQGFSMVIFPEGTRAKCSTVGEFKSGALKLATKPGVPVVPVSINGTYNVFERAGMIRPARVDVMIHEPIETKGLTRNEEARLAEHVHSVIREGVEKLASEDPESVFEPTAR